VSSSIAEMPVVPRVEDLVAVAIDTDLPAVPCRTGALEVRHDTCLACNRCSISTACPDEAYELRPTT